MLDLLQADSGTVCMNGTDVARSEEWKPSREPIWTKVS